MESLDVVRIRVKVVPCSRKFCLQPGSDGSIRVKLTEPPEDGRANRELAKRLSAEFNCSARIVKGHLNKNKEVELGLSLEGFKKRLAELNAEEKNIGDKQKRKKRV